MASTVNCWFCCEDSQVPAHARNAWECTKCDQFNGFTADGDVAQPASATARLRHVRYNVAVQPRRPPAWQLCHTCNANQALKTRQLAKFRPVRDDDWGAELEEYTQHLERLYQPCAYCQAVVARALREKDDMVRPAWLAWVRRQLPAPAEATGGAPSPGSAAHGVGAVLHRGLMLLQCAGLATLLLHHSLHPLVRAVSPEAHSAFVIAVGRTSDEHRAVLALACFALWVVTTEPHLRAATLAPLLLWLVFCAVGSTSASHVAEGNVVLLEAAVIGCLLVLAARRLRPGGAVSATRLTAQSLVNGAGNASSASLGGPPRLGSGTTPLLNDSLLSNGPSPLSNGPSPLSNGPSSLSNGPSPLSNGPSPQSSRSLPACSSPWQRSAAADPVQDDCSLLKLSLGSPRKSGGSQTVFALRTYQPDRSGAALFASPRHVLGPSRMRSELHHSAWIAGGYWQRGQPGPEPPPSSPHLFSRSSSQSSGFVDAYGPAGGSVLGDERPCVSPPAAVRGWAGSQCGDCRSCAGSVHEAFSCAGSVHEAHSCSGLTHNSSGGALSARSFASSQMTENSLLGMAANHKGVLTALLLGFSVAFNMFAVLVLFFRDRL